MNISYTSFLYKHTPTPTSRSSVSQPSRKEDFAVPSPTGPSKKEDTVTLSFTHLGQATTCRPKEPRPPIAIADMDLETQLKEAMIPDWLAPFYSRASSGLETPGDYIEPENIKFLNLTSGERTEYFILLEIHARELYEQNDLGNPLDKYDVVNSPIANEALRQDFINRVKGDPRMFALVKKLGLPLS